MAPRDIAPGHDYDEATIDAIDDCAVLLALLSSNANASRQVKHEIERAVPAALGQQIDRVQESAGVHIGMAPGDIELARTFRQ